MARNGRERTDREDLRREAADRPRRGQADGGRAGGSAAPSGTRSASVGERDTVACRDQIQSCDQFVHRYRYVFIGGALGLGVVLDGPAPEAPPAADRDRGRRRCARAGREAPAAVDVPIAAGARRWRAAWRCRPAARTIRGSVGPASSFQPGRPYAEERTAAADPPLRPGGAAGRVDVFAVEGEKCGAATGAVVGVDRDVLVAQVAGQVAGPRRSLARGPGRSCTRAAASRRGRRARASGSSTAHAAAHDRDVVEVELEPVGLERDAGVAGRGQDAAPVGIGAGDGGLDQRRRRDARAPPGGRPRALRAPRTSTVTTWWTPSPPRMSWRARSSSRSASASASGGGVAWPRPGAPLAMTSEHVVGRGVAVDGDRVVGARRTAAAGERASARPAPTPASVATKVSVVAMFGAIMPAPLVQPTSARAADLALGRSWRAGRW